MQRKKADHWVDLPLSIEILSLSSGGIRNFYQEYKSTDLFLRQGVVC